LIFIKKFLPQGKLEGCIARLVKNCERRFGAGQIQTNSCALRFHEVTDHSSMEPDMASYDVRRRRQGDARRRWWLPALYAGNGQNRQCRGRDKYARAL
jgi:hypothetical protein